MLTPDAIAAELPTLAAEITHLETQLMLRSSKREAQWRNAQNIRARLEHLKLRTKELQGWLRWHEGGRAPQVAGGR